MAINLFVEALTTLDSSYIDFEHGLSGNTFIVDLELSGTPDKTGMLLDFGIVKKAIKAQLESIADHLLLIPEDFPGLTHEACQAKPGEQLFKTKWHDQNGHQWQHIGPSISTQYIPGASLDIESLKQMLEHQLLDHWRSAQIQTIELTLRQETGDNIFQYSHGLKYHQGACQRIAHGHRSKVMAYTQAGFHAQYSQQLARWLDHKYLADQHNCKDQITANDQQAITLAYNAPEGYFELQPPKSQCIWLDKEVTIEHIAEFLLKQAQNTISRDIIKIRVYEGLKKGAIAQ